MKIFKRKSFKNILLYSLVLTMFFQLFAIYAKADDQDLWNIDTYDQYSAKNSTNKDATTEVTINAADYTSSSGTVTKQTDYMNDKGSSVLTGDNSTIEWSVDVPQTGKYTILVDYYPVAGKGGQMERKLTIDGKIPFSEAADFVFYRIWKDGAAIKQDSNGNDIRPTQVEAPAWTRTYLVDYYGYNTEPFEFNLDKGIHTIRFEAIKEPMVIKKLTLVSPEKTPTYAETRSNYEKQGYKNANDTETIQAENASFKSDSTIYPLYNRSSPAMEPYSANNIKLNEIGRDKWQTPGQWISWNVNVKKSGLYKIALRFKQDMQSGIYVSRKLSIDGKVPFEEAKDLKFNYKDGWQVAALGDGKQDYLFYLEAGERQLKLEVTLGDMAQTLQKVQNSVFALNDAYRKIIMITGAVPDTFRDYQFDTLIPDVIKTMHTQADFLRSVSTNMEKTVGQKGSQMTVLDKLVFDLETMYKDPTKIAAKLDSYKGNIGALATWVFESSKQPLELDWISVTNPTSTLPKAEKGFFAQVWHAVSMFLSTFFQDYYVVGGSADNKVVHKIKVWVGSGVLGGRDQAQILRQMIDDTFTPKTNISVDLQLVASGSLLPATLSGTGPDVTLQAGNSEPINYAIRNAVIDLSKFPGFKDTLKRFNPNAVVPYQFNGGVFALPETYSFPMLFYREDIFSELKLSPPQTWDDIYSLIPELQKRGMNIGIPASFDTFATMLYQSHQPIYSPNGDKCLLDSETSINVAKKWTEFYASYKLPLTYDFVNRFRTGEMPIAIANFTTYNQLSVFAPEIRGRWKFIPIPGTVQPDGTIDHSATATGAACIMMNCVKDKEAAWKFMQWWTDAPAQIRFGNELESLLGTAARYDSANMDAIQQIPWPATDYQNIMEQWKWVKGIPEVPGGYITSRYVEFAFKAVVNQGEDPGEQLIKYVGQINDELSRKQYEFGLYNKKK
jgi:ABC-type glycerol-3-phosphate transport system substrate-binding protein